MMSWKREIYRFIPLCALSLVGLWGDWLSVQVLLYAVGITVVIAYLSHILRRVLFPYLDLSAAWEKSNDTELGAALCFLGVCILLSTMMIVMVSLLR